MRVNATGRVKVFLDHLYEYASGYAFLLLGVVTPDQLQGALLGVGIPVKWVVLVVGVVVLLAKGASNASDPPTSGM